MKLTNDSLQKPRYWVVHNPHDFDCLIVTVSKSRDACLATFEQVYPEEYEEFCSGTSRYRTELIELTLVSK